MKRGGRASEAVQNCTRCHLHVIGYIGRLGEFRAFMLHHQVYGKVIDEKYYCGHCAPSHSTRLVVKATT